MPLSYLRRPLFLCLLAYVCLLALLHHRGFFRIPAPDLLERYHRLEEAKVLGRVVSPLKEDFRGQKVFIRADSLDNRPLPCKLLAYLPKGSDWSRLRPGMTIELTGRLRLPRMPRNPGEFDEEAFLEDRGASCIMSADTLQVLGQPPWNWLPKAWAEGARQSWEGFFRRTLPEDEARIFSGLTMGFKGPLRRDWNRTIQDAGATHLIVPSGAKVAFVMLSVAFLATLLRLPPWPRLALAVIVGGFYTLMVGAEAPYTRAFWGGTAIGIFLMSGRDSGAFQATVWAALLTLLWEPRELFNTGFQMTYAAVLGLITAMPGLQRVVKKLPRWLGRLACVACISVIVQIMLWPQFANTFGRGSVVGVMANMVLVPASGLLMAAGFSAWMIGQWVASGPVLSFLARLFMATCRAFASLPCAAVDLSPMSIPAVLIYYLLAAALLLVPRWKASAAAAAAGLLIWAGTAAAGRLTAPELSVLFLRLPPGHPALVSFADGRRWLVDPGTKTAAVAKTLRSRGVARLDRLILSADWPPRARQRLRRRLSWREAVRVPAPWRLCEQEVCFEFGGPQGPRVLRGAAQYSIIPERLKSGAVEVSTDGRHAEVLSPCLPERPSSSAPWWSSTTRPSPRPGA
ncbi:MAG: ComEC/Rec2 family competence protein [Elusimicrobia bacterium]|nr:ComEC/Rec2 family competence protein [Elusimicrobiota bacterium]